MMDLCGGQLTDSIVHPTRNGERLFLLFDFTHNFKNVFNNFTNKGEMDLPTFGYEHILGESCTANYNHIKQLYQLEETKTLKVAYALKQSSLDPNNLACPE